MRKNRSKEILEYFTKHSGTALSAKELSERFGISKRQVKNYIQQINDQTAPDMMIVPKSSGFYKLCDNYPDFLHIFQQPEYLPKERVSIILSKLLLSKEPLNIYDVADELYVSRPTIESDIKRMKKILDPFDVSLAISKDYLSIKGSEKSLRRVTSYMITNTEYKGFLVGNKNLFLKDDYQIDFIKSSIISIFKECNFIFNDYSINNVLLHLIIAIDRLKNHYEIEDAPIGIKVENVEIQAATMIADFLEDNYNIEYPQVERRNLAVFLSCNLATMDYRIVNSHLIKDYLDKGSFSLTKNILDRITDYYYLEPFDDIFFTRFVLHINQLMKRLNSNIAMHNPMCHDIQQAYPFIYDIAVFAAEIIQKETGYSINKDEISLIALHIGSFIESSQINKNKISAIYIYADYHGFYQTNVFTLQQKYSDQLNLQYCISIMDYNKTPITAEMIISEVPLEHAILVSPFITNDQLKEIGKRIETQIQTKESENFNLSLRQMFTEDIFFQNICGENKYVILENIGNQLMERGYVDNAFIDSVIKREQLSSTCFTNGLAIPHAISPNVKKSFISFTRYDHSQAWDDKTVSIIIFIGISYPDRKTFRSVFNHLVKLFEKQTSISEVAKCTNYEDIIQTINILIQ